jgi:hypothetical protein
MSRARLPPPRLPKDPTPTCCGSCTLCTCLVPTGTPKSPDCVADRGGRCPHCLKVALHTIDSERTMSRDVYRYGVPSLLSVLPPPPLCTCVTRYLWE